MANESPTFVTSVLPWFLALVLTGFGTAGLWVATGLRDDAREVRQHINGNTASINEVSNTAYRNTKDIGDLRERVRNIEKLITHRRETGKWPKPKEDTEEEQSELPMKYEKQRSY